MNEILKKAVEGGYENWRRPCSCKLMHDENGCLPGVHYAPLEELVLDAKFFQSLGKVCGWTQAMWIDTYPSRQFGFLHKRKIENGKYVNTERWQFEAMTFHEINLTEGWEKAVSWLEELITSKN